MSEGRPASGFVVTRQFAWFECEDEDGAKGLAVKVRKNITNKERDELNEYYVEHIVKYQADWLKLTDDEREEIDAKGDTPRDREWKLLADYIEDWNAQAEDDDGKVHELPSPKAAGPVVFELVTKDVVDWCLKTVLYGYRATGKANGLRDG